jgi:hypothetical protein
MMPAQAGTAARPRHQLFTWRGVTPASRAKASWETLVRASAWRHHRTEFHQGDAFGRFGRRQHRVCAVQRRGPPQKARISGDFWRFLWLWRGREAR